MAAVKANGSAAAAARALWIPVGVATERMRKMAASNKAKKAIAKKTAKKKVVSKKSTKRT